MVIQHNPISFKARNRLKTNVSCLKKSSEKLSSGYRINRAGDDAAGLGVSEKMRSQLRGLNQAVRNSQDGINMIQTFEGAAQESQSVLQRMKELAAESANGNYDNTTDRAAIQSEFCQLSDELDHIAETDFNGIVMLGGEPDSKTNAAKHKNRIGSVFENLPDTVSETTAQTAALNIETKTYAASAAAFAAPRAGGTICGDFTVYGNSSDFSFDTASGVLTILGGDVTVKGTGAATTNTIVVAKDKSANVTLRNVNIDVSSRDNACAFKIENNSKGDVTVMLEENNVLKSGERCAGLQKNGGVNTGKLTINGDGSLNAYGGDGGAGIGGAGISEDYSILLGVPDGSSSNITISNGTVYAKGGSGAAGVGGGGNGDGTNITISGGTVTAIASDHGAGIGGGRKGVYSDKGDGIDITICGGTVIASSESQGAGIGGGQSASGNNITISGGTVTASSESQGAGIGGGSYGDGSNIIISNGTVTANGGDEGGSGIGGGNCGDGINITINGGTVIANAGVGVGGGAGIGGGSSYELEGYGRGINIIISGGTVIAKGSDNPYYWGGY